MSHLLKSAVRPGLASVIGCLTGALAAAHAQSDPDEPGLLSASNWSFELSAGVEADSNVSVNELDTQTGTDDIAIRLRAEIDFEADIAADTEFKLGYTISDKSYNDFSEFDLTTQIASTSLNHDFGPVTAGVIARYIDADLGGSGFQNVTQLSPYASGFLTKSLFLRGAYTYGDKSFDVQAMRDADVHTVDLDGYYFLDGTRQYLVASYEYETSDAVDPQFTYDSHGVGLRLSQRFEFRERTARAQFRVRYEERDFDGVTPSINAVRNDKRTRLNAELEVPISDRFFAAAEYEFGNFQSNLPSADYDQNVITVRLGVRF